jgi:uncharacterized protein YndB with AHSA1/START domain
VSSTVLVALRIAAPPARVFDAFVNEVGAWWRPNTLFAFTPRPPGRLAFEPGIGGRFTETLANGHVFEIGRIVEWEPPERLGFTWRQATFAQGQQTQVSVRFEPVDDGTRVTVEHRGWDTVPTGHVARHGMPATLFLRRHAEWWRTLLSALSESSAP